MKPSFSEQITDYLSVQFNLPKDQVAAMLPEFENALKMHMANLRTVHNNKELNGLEKAAHTIKGAFLNLGLTNGADVALQLERAAADQTTTADFNNLISQIEFIVNDIVGE